MEAGKLHLKVLVGLLTLSVAAGAWADPIPLENAYWRFEEPGFTEDDLVPEGPGTVIESLNGYHMRRAGDINAPHYTASVSPVPLRSGDPNTQALNFESWGFGGRDVYTDWGTELNKQLPTAFTIEAAFRPAAVDAFQTIVSKEGYPNGNNVYQTAALKLLDNNKLAWQQYDKAGNFVEVVSDAALAQDVWYHAAVVNNGSTLSLYLDTYGDGSGYVLQSQTAIVDGALFDIEHVWNIGKGAHDGGLAHWFTGTIDEVRISNTALSPDEFVFVPEPASLILLGLGGLCMLRRRR